MQLSLFNTELNTALCNAEEESEEAVLTPAESPQEHAAVTV